MPGVYLLTHSLTTSTPTSSPCTLLTLCSSKALVQGPTALLWQRWWPIVLPPERNIASLIASSHVWGALLCHLRSFRNSSMSTTQLFLCNCSLPMTPLPKGTSTMTPASLTLSVSFSMCMIVFRHGVSTKSSSITFTTEELQCWPCTMALMHNVTMLNYIKHLSNLGRTSVTIVTTIKRLFLPSNTSRLPPFLPAFSSLWRMNNLRLVKAL